MADASRLDFDEHLSFARPLEIDLNHLKRFTCGDGDGSTCLHLLLTPRNSNHVVKNRGARLRHSGQFVPSASNPASASNVVVENRILGARAVVWWRYHFQSETMQAATAIGRVMRQQVPDRCLPRLQL